MINSNIETNHVHPFDTTTTNKNISNTTTSTSSGGNARARARAREDAGLCEEDLAVLDDAYYDAFRRSAPFTVQSIWQRYHSVGMETALMLQAIDETMLAPYPSPRYMIAVLGRWMRDGILTEAQRSAEQERREAWIAAQHRRRDEERYGYRETAWGDTYSTRSGEIIDT